MAKKQWVNLPETSTSTVDRSKMTGDGVDSEDVMGQTIYIKATLDKKNAAAVATLTVKPDGNNAVYVTGDKTYVQADKTAIAKVATDGEASWKVKLSVAGGDKFKFEVECNKEKKELPDEFETHRRLYYQVIDMDSVTGLPDLSFWKTSFEKNNRLIHLHSVSSKGKIARSYNFKNESSEHTRLLNLAKAQYDTAKDPYCFAVIWADCLAEGPTPEVCVKSGVSKGGSVNLLVTSGRQLWKNIDKSKGATEWLSLAAFIYNKDGSEKTFPIPDADVTSTYTKITVNTHNFPDGVKGTIKVSVNVAVGFSGGWSFNAKNVIVIATRSWEDTAYSETKKKAILIHEAGHKMGQVPDGDGALKKQDTHDDVHDPAKNGHCNDRDCTMWYTTEYLKVEYCSSCDKSLRKQNLHFRIPGLTRFF